ncbi:DUF4160 domain-containing protein [uncultured Devosia sp.]|uniref:DUF4160 domain-containing protein n=1 Tax=uncultured Devosia sp. TaxID=211434 RepID=UPI0035CA51F9
MPTILRLNGYRFFFYSRENDGPPHIHVEFADKLAKYWLEPVELASSQRVRAHELGGVRRLVVEHRTDFLKAWYEHFSSED